MPCVSATQHAPRPTRRSRDLSRAERRSRTNHATRATPHAQVEGFIPSGTAKPDQPRNTRHAPRAGRGIYPEQDGEAGPTTPHAPRNTRRSRDLSRAERQSRTNHATRATPHAQVEGFIPSGTAKPDQLRGTSEQGPVAPLAQLRGCSGITPRLGCAFGATAFTREVPTGALAHAVPSDQRSPEGTGGGGSWRHAQIF